MLSSVAVRIGRVACHFATFAVGLLFAATAGADGGVSCASSTDCAPPNLYCHPTSHTCVECLGDRNCPTDEICDTTTNTCRGCVSDADCSSAAPFCEASRGQCVECLSDKNCGFAGVSCIAGKCGSCGDGICGPREGIYFEDSFGFPGPPPPPGPPRVICPEDCASLCPSKDIGEGLGKFSVSGAGLRNIFSNGCNNGVEGVEATFAWTAPEDGTFSFSGSGISLLVLQGVCTDPGGGACSTGGFGDSGLGFGRVSLQLAKGDQVTIVVDTASMSVDTVTVEIVTGQPTCGLFGCSPPPSDAGQGSEGGNDQGATICLDNAAARGETLCSGVECVCHHCPQDYDDCAVIPGCKDIRECMRGKNCIGTECYNSGSCRAAVDSFAGVSGPAFKAAVRVQSCELSFQCALPCGADAGSTDAGVPSSDAGRLCEPGRKVACDCEGGTGTKTCSKDGNGYEACACGAPKPQPSDSGCGCRVAGPPRTPPYGLGAALAVVLACARRRPRRIARGVAT